MRNAFSIFCCVVLLIQLPEKSASQIFEAPIDSLIRKSLVLTINQKFDSAETVCAEIMNLDWQNPIGTLMLAATLQSKMMDYETDQWESDFFSNIDKSIRLSEHLLKTTEKSASLYFIIGSAYCYKSFYCGKKERLLSAFKNATKGIDYMNRALAIDSTVYDAYLAIGSYKYWKSRKLNFITWLPFLSDDRSQGIQMIQKTIEHGSISRYAAINGLAWIYLDAGRIDEAIQTATMGCQAFPESRFFLWCLADCYFKKPDFVNAKLNYQKILDSILTKEFNNHYNEIVCRYKIAACLHALEKYRESKTQCEAIATLSLSEPIAKRAASYLKKAQQLKQMNENALYHANITD
ncbi:hypothetical protein JXJ21_18350 [candidate division KSB1 bacterium]|nr:hypothetical protein [candidate division KSB1 bacterium]